MKNKSTKWCAFFSQTGNEIATISRSLGRWPDYIVTNRMDDNGVNPRILQRHTQKLIRIPKWPKEMDYLNIADDMGFSILNDKWKDNVIITLHGYLRILPACFCDNKKIYNGHPGLITKYPELKGLDPQKKAFEAGTYETIGSDYDNLENCTLALHDLSIQLWTKFLKNKI